MDEDLPLVLIVDDVPTNLKLLEAQLRTTSCQVVQAHSGLEALERLSEHEFALMLLDAQMPEMDGFEVARRAREGRRSRELPIIFLTGMPAAEESALRGYDIGAVDFLFKPVNPVVLRGKVSVFLELHRARQRVIEAREQALELEAARRLAAVKESLLQELQEKNTALGLANVDLEQFAYVASHDLRAPLRTIKLYSDILGREYSQVLDDEGRSHLRFVHNSAGRLQRLVDDLLTYTRLHQDPPRGPVDMAQLVDDIVEELLAPLDDEDVTVVRDDLPTVTAAASQIRQVMQNLITNALKFRRPSFLLVEIRVRATANDWEFSVRDNGIGIDPGFAERAFQLFQRYHPSAEYPGSGLGLTIARGIIHRHGGRISAQPRDGGGTDVSFTLPRAAAGAKTGTGSSDCKIGGDQWE
jgi:two-component system, sensor histidine kinase and response regulator